jgi:S1-C subfamily serine protease
MAARSGGGLAAIIRWASISSVLILAPMAVVHAALPDTVDRIKPSIVAVGTLQATRSPAFSFRGTGFVVGDGNLVATNAHVVPEVLDHEVNEALVIAVPGAAGEPQTRSATSLAVDTAHDIALLRISGPPLPALTLRATGSVREGESAAFTGFPLGSALGLSPVTHRATVSAVTPIAIPGSNAQHLNEKLVRRLKVGSFSVLQLDATAYPGNSGSPLYDVASGEVMGIINMVYVKGTKEAAMTQPSGISFAMPISFLVDLMQSKR